MLRSETWGDLTGMWLALTEPEALLVGLEPGVGDGDDSVLKCAGSGILSGEC